MASPKPMPTALRLITGNAGKRAINKNEPKLSIQKVKAPSHFTEKEIIWFDELNELLHRMGVMTVADAIAAEMLISAYSEFRTLDECIKEEKEIYKVNDALGNQLIKKNPAVPMRADAWRRVSSMLQEFGLTPSSRSKVSLPDDGKNKDSDFLNDLMSPHR